MRTRKGVRSRIETYAREQCRSLVHKQGSYITKIDSKRIFVGECERWPDGVVLEYRGWIDLLRRLDDCLSRPNSVVNGRYRPLQTEAAA